MTTQIPFLMFSGNKSSVETYIYIKGMFHSIENENDSKNLEDLLDLEEKTKHAEVEEKFGKQASHYGTSDHPKYSRKQSKTQMKTYLRRVNSIQKHLKK